jgi:hypothetical protein
MPTKILILAAALAAAPGVLAAGQAESASGSGGAPAAGASAHAPASAVSRAPAAVQRPVDRRMLAQSAYPYRGPMGPQPYGRPRPPAVPEPVAPAAPAPEAAPDPGREAAHKGCGPQHRHRARGGEEGACPEAAAAAGDDASRREMIEVLERIEARLGRIEQLLGQFTF